MHRVAAEESGCASCEFRAAVELAGMDHVILADEAAQLEELAEVPKRA